jgi:hypothetical protein
MQAGQQHTHLAGHAQDDYLGKVSIAISLASLTLYLNWGGAAS